ncbi:Endolytic murein transglycosylase [Vibrio stylophorae]|uniref:Endolytic murein transglycosylase n=1 Tax=Vibrio stylophorae TaxID=659351 RepID=A0ABM8ZRW6_9VIBR|nr:endolytic transglycosylase MltG [Vibrio stylophorae]CAH0533035.1 Endolytic murein transglycosylase [Vibrio stylophorae]
MLKKLFIAAILGLVAVAAAAGYVYQQATGYLDQTNQLSEPSLFEVKRGMSFAAVTAALQAQGIATNNPWTRLIPKLDPKLAKIKVGVYQIAPKLTVRQVLEVLVAGKEHQFSITLIEGERFTDWRKRLEAAPYLKQTMAEMSEAEIATAIGADRTKLEGLLLPETYNYAHGSTDIALLKRAYDDMQALMVASWPKRAKASELDTPYEALILASIIEKETAVANERGKVASVFNNRLIKGMRLQTDPTVIYGMGDKYDGNIRRKDLRTPTPYNTYVIYGLPPTPIAMASKESVLAALNPDKTPYYYFVADGTGGHKFSRTLREHNRAVQAYLRTLRQNK